ncbi:MAG: diguanylate cyclase [Piscirickettsiaceae bacterium]|nr:diguanylate cyclase [Piscirickettsiaceae bacterium]
MRKLNALVIDGSKLFRSIVQELLEKSGFTVTVAESGESGLELAKQERFTLVCCCFHLGGMSGSEFCGQIRSIAGYDFASVIVLADEDNSKLVKQALLAGATDIFSKKDLTELEVYLDRFAERETRQLSGRVLFIEDSRVLQEIIIDLLTDMGLDVDAYTHAEGAWEAYEDGYYDLVITDIMLEGAMSGISLVRKIRRSQGEYGNIPIIATSGFDNVSRKIELFHLGVNDYVAKPIIREELRQRVYNHVTGYQGLLELQAQQKSLYSLAMLDELTQLFNRHALREFSGKYFSESRRFNRPLTLAVLDIDHFKNINETYGYPKGDEVLAGLGTWLKRFVRDEDLVARWAGEEFIFLLPNCDSTKAESLMNRLQKRLSQFKPANLTLTVSIGIATMTGEASQTLNSLFELADGAMYQAKMSGRNCVKIYQENN